MIQQITDLQLVDNHYEGKVHLPVWTAFGLPDEPPKNGMIRISIGTAHGEAPHVISEADTQAVAYMIANCEAHQAIMLQKLLEEYPKWQPDYGYSPEDAKFFMPDVTSVDDFKKLISLIYLHILPVSYDGMAYIGYEFNAKWDVEHGFGCMFHARRIVDFGMAESSFLRWKAESDVEAQSKK
jgi:hypothetical protein